jgi:hypothetical protein
MPFTVNGFGTSVCGGRGNVGWGSYDAVEWVVAFMMPIIPIKCVHTFDWNGNQYRQLPIRWSGGLILHTFLNRWLWGVGIVGGLLMVFGIFALADKATLVSPLLLLAGAIVIGLAIGAGFLLRATDARNKKVRLVLGAVTIGNCDPAHFTDDTLRQMAGNPSMIYDTPSYARAAEKLLEQGSYAQAMWAARLCVAVEDAAEGESLTDAILRDPKVAEAIEQVRRDSRSWSELMLTEEERTAPDDRRRRDEKEDDRPRRRDDRRIREEDEDDRPRRRDYQDDRRRSRREDEDDRPRRRLREDEDY